MRWARRVRIAVGAVASAIMLVVLFGPRASIGGFSPDSLMGGRQTALMMPVLHVEIYRTGRSTESRWPLAEYLIRKGYWAPLDTSSPRWWITSETSSAWRCGVGQFEYQLLGQGKTWIEWSEAHPDLAARVWPEILATMRSGSEDYEAVTTGLLSLARESASVAEFERDRDRLLRER